MDNSQISKIYEALDVDKQGYISLDVVQSFIEDFQRSSPDGQQLDTFSTLLLQKAHSDGHLYLEDFEAAVQALQEMDSPPKSPGAQLTPSGSVELRSSQETLVDPASGGSTTGVSNSWPGGTPHSLHKSPSQLSKDDSNDTQSDSGVHDCVTSLDQVIAENEEHGSPVTSPRSGYSARGSSFGGVGGPPTDEESYEDYGESENDFSLRSADVSHGAGSALTAPAVDVGRKSPARLLKPPPHPGTSGQNRADSARGTWPRRRQSYGGPWNGQQSAARQAHDLYSSSLNCSPYSSHSEGLCPDVSAAQFENIHEILSALQGQVSSLNDNQQDAQLKYNKLLEENSTLKHTVNSLTDSLNNVETRSVGSLDTEKRQLREKMERIDRERSEELGNLRNRLHTLETETAEARLEAMRYKTEAERLKLEKLRAEEKLSSAEDQVRTLNDERCRYLDIHKRELECMRKERDHSNHLLEELSRQHEEGRLRSASSLSNGVSGDLKLSDVYERFKEAQEVVKRLTKENRSFREQLEETQAELLTRTLEQGKSLTQRSESSLAAELDNCTKDESTLEEECKFEDDCPHAIGRRKLMEILVKEKDANQKLRGYIDNILTRIIEQNPSLLEVCTMGQV